MVHISIKKGLDIPIKGKPPLELRNRVPSEEASPLHHPSQLSLNLASFDDIKFSLLVSPGEIVKIGQPLTEDKGCSGRMFVSPAGGVVKEIQRGFKRSLRNIIIEVSEKEEYVEFDSLDVDKCSVEQLIDRLKVSGSFAKIRSRPFNLLANPLAQPKSIFVKAIESAPFKPSAEMQLMGYEKEFQMGLNVLSKLLKGPVHLVHHKNSDCAAFTQARNVQIHTAKGPHPIGNVSVHIQYIDRITQTNQEIWTLTVHDVVSIGFLFMHNRILIHKVISIAGPGIVPHQLGYFILRQGYPIEALISGRIGKGNLRFISGDPLTGQTVAPEDFMGYYENVFCVIPENHSREFLHFFRLGTNKYSHSAAYVSGHMSTKNREYDFTTNLHGEHRAFIDGSVYDSVMPLDVPVMLLTKAVMAEDFELAEQYGLLEVDSEDFALPTFVCPSKIEIADIIKRGLKFYSKEILTN